MKTSTNFVATLLSALAFAFVGSAHAQLFLPSTGADREMGAQVAQQVEKRIGLLPAPALQDYVRVVGRRLVNEASDDRFQFSFDLVDQLEPNAFAAPGGYIFVSRGLLALLNSEDELADVLAHEIIHVTRRHSAKQERRGFLPGLLSVPGHVVGRVVDEDIGRLINAPASVLGGVTLASHSRAQEREADDRGLKLAAATGYDPSALATILTRMEKTIALVVPESTQRKPSFFDTHPTTSSRARDIERVASGLRRSSRPPVTTNREDFLRRLDGLVLGENPAHGVFDGVRFIHPHLQFTLRFPADWKLVNTPRAVAAIKRDGSAAMILGIAGQGEDPEPPARAFLEKLRESRLHPTRAERAQAGAWPAFVVSVSDTTDRLRSEMHFVWAAHEGRIYQLIGLGTPEDVQVIRTSALTLREATPAELSAVTVRRLRLAAAQPGESLEALSGRVGNVWSADLAALVNDLPRQAPLVGGQLLKIAKSEPYVAR